MLQLENFCKFHEIANFECSQIPGNIDIPLRFTSPQVGECVAEPGEYSISMIAGGNHTLIPNLPPAYTAPRLSHRVCSDTSLPLGGRWLRRQAKPEGE